MSACRVILKQELNTEDKIFRSQKSAFGSVMARACGAARLEIYLFIVRGSVKNVSERSI